MRSRFVLLVLFIVTPSYLSATPVLRAPSHLIAAPGKPTGVAIVDVDGNGSGDHLAVSLLEGGLAVTPVSNFQRTGPWTTLFANQPLGRVDVGDFDGDGLRDLAGSGSFTGTEKTVVIAFGNGAGGFPATFVMSFRRPGQIGLVGDLNGDGRTDFVYEDADTDSIEVFLGSASRSMSPAGAFAVAAIPGHIEMVSLVGSPAQDLVVSYPLVTGYSVLTGVGDGTFGPRIDHPTSEAIKTFGFQFPNTPDVAMIPMTTSRLKLWRNDGNGGFNEFSVIQSVQFLSDMVMADVTTDGIPDIVIGKGSPAPRGISVIRYNGTYEYASEVISAGSPHPVDRIAIGNLDADGFADVAWTSATAPFVMLAKNYAAGTFEAMRWPVFEGLPGVFRDFAVADFDGDGLPDLVINAADVIACFPMRPNGTNEFWDERFTGKFFSSIVVDLFDGDSVPDVVGVTDSPPYKLWMMSGDPGMRVGAPQYGYTLGSAPQRPTIEDVDGDHLPDIVIPCRDSNGLWIVSDASGVLQPPIVEPVSTGPLMVRYADFDHDSHRDRLIACTAQLVFQKSDGLGGYGAPVSIPLDHVPLAFQLGDIDKDGELDAVLTENDFSQSPLLHVFRGHGDGTFGPEIVQDLDYSAGGSLNNFPVLNGLELVDIDEDGRLDAVLREGANASVLIARGFGDGTFQTPQAYGTLSQPKIMRVADYDLDGMKDVIVGGQVVNQFGSFPDLRFLRNEVVRGIVDIPAVGTPARVAALAISRLQPNPARGAVALTVVAAIAGSARVSLHSANGRLARPGENVRLAPGENRVPIEMSGLTPGLYWVRITQGAETAVRRVVVVRD